MIQYAIENNRFNMVKLLYNGDTLYAGYLLEIAAGRGYKDIVEFLIDVGADIHHDIDGPLQVSSQNGHLEIVELLLNKGADIHADVDSPLILASMNGHLKVVELLLDRGASNIQYALNWVRDSNHLKIIEILLQRGGV